MDGWLIQGVVTTRIYCRPSCSARPNPENVRVFENAAAARAAGLRACKRCRPDELEVGLVRHLPYKAPLDVAGLLAFFGRRVVPGVEEFDGEVYRRSLRGLGVVEIRDLGDRIGVRMHLNRKRDEGKALGKVRALLDLDADPAEINDALRRDALMGRLVDLNPGRRVPGCASGDEIALRAILGQQISVERAAMLAGHLVAEYGEPLRKPVGAVTHAWPEPQALAEGAGEARGADARRSPWGMPASRIRAIRAISAAIADGDLVLDSNADRRETEDRLLALPGIGPWTASYIAMRALRDPDAFLAGDLGVRHALDRLGLDSRPAAAEALSQAWRPYRAYANQHLWAVAS